MSYEAWRISYQSSEQAARVAYGEWQNALEQAKKWKALADAAAAGLGAWQPIKTAPKDGTTAVDLWFPKSGRRTEWRWFKKGRFWGSNTVGRFNKIERCFDEDPTHWMPLPEAPNTRS